MTLKKALFEFVEWGSSHYAARTVQTYNDLLSRFLKFSSKVTIEEVDITDITAYVVHLKKKGYAESSVAYSIISLRVFFKYLFMRRLTNWDYQLIKVPKYVSKNFPTVTRDEVASMMKNVRRRDFLGLRDRMVIQFLFATGLRVSELCDLRLSDLDTEEREGIILSKKSRKKRVIYWDLRTHYVLKSYLYERELYASTDHFVIGLNRASIGRGVTPRTIQRVISKYRAPGTSTVPHSYRSGLITDMLEEGVSLQVMKDILGHSSLRSLDPYARVKKPYAKKEYRRVRERCG